MNSSSGSNSSGVNSTEHSDLDNASNSNSNSAMQSCGNSSAEASDDSSKTASHSNSAGGSPLQYDFGDELPDTPPELPLLLPIASSTATNNTNNENNSSNNDSCNNSRLANAQEARDMQALGLGMTSDSLAQFEGLGQGLEGGSDSPDLLTDLDIDEAFFDQYS